MEWLSSYLTKACPEIHEGDHISSVDILLSGSPESASVELLKLAVFLLSNNMNPDTTGPGAVGFLEMCGLLTRSNVHWLINTCDETSEALLDALLRESLTRSDGDLLSWLLDGPIDVERTISTYVQVYHSGFRTLTLLQAASCEGSVPCCEILLNAGADPNRRLYENTCLPLEYALGQYSEGEVTRLVELLLSRGANLIESTREKILSQAIEKGYSSLALKMIQQGAKISPGMFVSIARTYTVVKMVRLFCAYPDSWTHPDSTSPTIQDMLTPKVLESAIHVGSYETIEFLLRIGADANGVDDQITPIEYICSSMNHVATVELKIKMIRLLLKYGGQVDRSSSTIPSALQLAANEGTVLIVQTLLDVGANVNACLPEDSFISLPRYPRWESCAPTPLLTALKNSHIRVAKTILQYRPRLMGPELAEAARIGDLQLVNMLLAAGARLQGDELEYAVEYRNPRIIRRLFQKGARITERISALEIALLLNDFNIISFELDHAAYDSVCLYGATSLALKESRYLFVVEKLVSRRPITIRDDLEVAALAIAVMNHSPQLCYLLSNPKFLPGSWVVTLHSHLGTKQTAFLPQWKPYIILSSNNIFDLYPWTSRSARLNPQNKHGRRIHVLGLAAWFESDFPRNHAVKALIKLGALSGHLNLYRLFFSQISNEPLVRIIEACQEAGTWLGTTRNIISLSLDIVIITRPELVKTLLDARFDANAKPPFIPPWSLDKSRTPLQRAIEKADIGIIRQLLEAGADVNAPAGYYKGATCLQIAAIKGDIGLARMLLERGANVNAPRARLFGRTAIEGAAENGRLDMTKLLLLRQEDNTIERHRIQFIRAVKFATEYGYCAIANMLKRHMQWNGHDQTLYEGIDTEARDIIDEMTQELSLYELEQLGICHSTDEIEYDESTSHLAEGPCSSLYEREYNDISGDFRNGNAGGGMLSTQNDNQSETELHTGEQETTTAQSDTLAGGHLLGSAEETWDIPRDDIDIPGENTGDGLYAPLDPLDSITEPNLEITVKGFHQQDQGYLPILSTDDSPAGVLEITDRNPFMGADIDDVIEELREDFYY